MQKLMGDVNATNTFNLEFFASLLFSRENKTLQKWQTHSVEY